MKISRLFNSLPKRLFAGLLLFLAIMLPVATSAASAVKIEGSMGVANVTAGATTYSHSTNATYNQVVKLQVYYHNTELPDSGKTAQNLRVKINIPTAPGQVQKQTATISADNSNTVTDSTTVNLDRSDAYLQYIPGSAVWRHNTGTNDNIKETDTTVSDNIVTSGTGIVLENEQPCYNFSATVTVLARVMVPGVSVNKYVRANGSTNWATSITAKPGDTIQYEIAYKNTGNATEESVEFRDQLPKGITYVPGTTMLKNSVYPNGTKVNSDALVSNGIIADSYAPGAAGYVMFNAKVADDSALSCGDNQLRNIAFVQPKGMNYYYNTADVNVTKTCTTPPKTPVYSCDLLTLSQDKTDNHKVTASVAYTATNGATLKMVTYNFGDQKSTSVITTDKTTQDYLYTTDGTFNVTATLTFSVNGKDVTGVTSDKCAQPVTTSSTPTPPVTPPTTPPSLPNTGAGNVIGVFAAVVAASTIGYRLFLSRKLARR